jgi:putative SOS response-associated peptidase YedK
MHHEADELIERFQLAEIRDQYQGSFNFAPSQQVPVVVLQDNQRVLETMRWGLVPSWAKDTKIGYKMINARCEGIETKPAYRSAIKHRRCLIPVDGFYEWRKDNDSDTKIPYYIGVEGAEIFAFAGLWEKWQSPDSAEPLHSCTIITTAPNQQMEKIHNRMPVIIDPQNESKWLDPSIPVEDALQLLNPYESHLNMFPVSTAVNSPKNNGEDLIAPAKRIGTNTEGELEHQMELF